MGLRRVVGEGDGRRGRGRGCGVAVPRVDRKAVVVKRLWKVSAALLAAAVLLLWWAANHPDGMLDRVVSALLPEWMGEDR